MKRCDILATEVNVAYIFPIRVRLNILQRLDEKMVAPSETIFLTLNEVATCSFDNGASWNIPFVNLIQCEFRKFAHVKGNVSRAWIRRDIG
jgi:hypothetical protein